MCLAVSSREVDSIRTSEHQTAEEAGPQGLFGRCGLSVPFRRGRKICCCSHPSIRFHAEDNGVWQNKKSALAHTLYNAFALTSELPVLLSIPAARRAWSIQARLHHPSSSLGVTQGLVAGRGIFFRAAPHVVRSQSSCHAYMMTTCHPFHRVASPRHCGFCRPCKYLDVTGGEKGNTATNCCQSVSVIQSFTPVSFSNLFSHARGTPSALIN